MSTVPPRKTRHMHRTAGHRRMRVVVRMRSRWMLVMLAVRQVMTAVSGERVWSRGRLSQRWLTVPSSSLSVPAMQTAVFVAPMA